MIVSKEISIKKLYSFTKENLWFLVATSSFALIAVHFVEEAVFKGLSYPAGFMGTALAILIGFRNNSAYDRWWTARKEWDKLVSDSRHLGLMAIGFIIQNEEATIETVENERRKIIYRHIAFVWALNKHLRKISWDESVSDFINQKEMELLRRKDNVPLALLSMQASEFGRLNEERLIPNLGHVQFDLILKNFNDVFSRCEGIKNTVFPMQYNWFMQYAIWVFLLIFPFSIAGYLGYWFFPFSIVIGYVFIMLEYVGFHIENPFENGINDIPIDNISRLIEINLKEILSETNLPEMTSPLNGRYLY